AIVYLQTWPWSTGDATLFASTGPGASRRSGRGRSRGRLDDRGGLESATAVPGLPGRSGSRLAGIVPAVVGPDAGAAGHIPAPGPAAGGAGDGIVGIMGDLIFTAGDRDVRGEIIGLGLADRAAHGPAGSGHAAVPPTPLALPCLVGHDDSPSDPPG